MTEKRRILFLTGTRADFGKLKPLMRKVDCAPEFECQIFATGMHMLPRYGLTVNEIFKAGFRNVFSHINQDGLTTGRTDLVLSNTVQGLGNFVQEFRPDLLVVHGDRVEALAGAIVGAFNNILTAHVEGGELSGTIDELIRHAVTKLSHVHFVSNEESKRRLIQLGEAPGSVFVIGSPDVDVMLSGSLPDLEDVKRKYEIPFSEYCILIYHPVTTELPLLEERVSSLVDAAVASGLNFIVVYPNNDPGSHIVLNRFLPLQELSRFRVIPSMRFEYFLATLRGAMAILGNSSAGIHEAPVFGVPTVNVGSRQRNRWQHESIIEVDDDRDAILTCLRGLPDRFSPSLAFGKGNSAELFLNHLQSEALWEISHQKQFRDLPGWSGEIVS